MVSCWALWATPPTAQGWRTQQDGSPELSKPSPVPTPAPSGAGPRGSGETTVAAVGSHPGAPSPGPYPDLRGALGAPSFLGTKAARDVCRHTRWMPRFCEVGEHRCLRTRPRGPFCAGRRPRPALRWQRREQEILDTRSYRVSHASAWGCQRPPRARSSLLRVTCPEASSAPLGQEDPRYQVTFRLFLSQLPWKPPSPPDLCLSDREGPSGAPARPRAIPDYGWVPPVVTHTHANWCGLNPS